MSLFFLGNVCCHRALCTVMAVEARGPRREPLFPAVPSPLILMSYLRVRKDPIIRYFRCV